MILFPRTTFRSFWDIFLRVNVLRGNSMSSFWRTSIYKFPLKKLYEFLLEKKIESFIHRFIDESMNRVIELHTPVS